MTNELIAGRCIANIGAAHADSHGMQDEHHTPEDWRAYFHSLDHKTVFERRFQAPAAPKSSDGTPPAA